MKCLLVEKHRADLAFTQREQHRFERIEDPLLIDQAEVDLPSLLLGMRFRQFRKVLAVQSAAAEVEDGGVVIPRIGFLGKTNEMQHAGRRRSAEAGDVLGVPTTKVVVG